MTTKNPHILLLQHGHADSEKIYKLLKQAVISEFSEAIVETIENLQNIYKKESGSIEKAISKADLIIGNLDGGNVSVTSSLSIAISNNKSILLILPTERSTSISSELVGLPNMMFALENPDNFINNLRENIKEILEPESQADIRFLKFLLSQKESEWIDFKREFHKNKAELLHDILCLSNSAHNGDRYLIFGVANNKTIYGIENDPNKKTNADLQDFLRQVALNSIPKVELTFHQFNFQEIGVLKIKNLPKKPYWMTKEYRNGNSSIRAGAIYTRLGDTNIPLGETAPEDHIEAMWIERFGLFEKSQKILDEFQLIKNKILMNSLEPVIREELKKLQEFFHKYPGFLNSDKVSTFYRTFIIPREIHLHFGANLNFTQSEYEDFRKQLFEIDLSTMKDYVS